MSHRSCPTNVEGLLAGSALSRAEEADVESFCFFRIATSTVQKQGSEGKVPALDGP